MDTEAPSLRETLEAAFDAHSEPTEAPSPEPTPAPEPAPTPDTGDAPTEPAEAPAPKVASERARDPKGRFAAKLQELAEAKAAKAEGKAPAPKPAKAPPNVAKVTPKPDGAPVDAPKPEAAPAVNKAPQNWKPAAREKWASLPPEVQAEAIRVDREARQALGEAANARKGWDAFTRAVAPYQAMIQADGADPVTATASLFQTAAVLRTGTPHQKAQLVADIARTYGVDIGLLDGALAGQAQAPNGQQAAPQYRDPRVDQLFAQINQAQTQRAQSMQQKAQSDIDAMAAKLEFFEDVRQDMADVLEMAARRGVTMSPEDAYNRAIRMHPEVSKVLAQREQAQAANAQAASTMQRRAASVSVRTRPAGPTPAPAPNDLRAALEAAYDAHFR